MTDEKLRNAWGDGITGPLDDDPWEVPKDQRKEVDDHESNALDDETGDDLDGWQPGDPV